MRRFKQDNFNGNGDYGDMFATVWITEAASAADWIALKTNDATNPAGLEGFSFRKAINSNADATYNTIGVLTVTITAAGYAQVQIGGKYASANVATAVTIGQDLVISSTSARATAVGVETTSTRIIGRALAGASSNLCDVEIVPHPMFLN
jgi:hypothetical protein